MFENFFKIDFVLLLVVLILVFSGLIMIYSASSFKAQSSFQDSHYYLKKHFIRVIMGLCLMIIAMYVDYHIIQRIAPFIFLFALLLLIYVLINPAASGMTGTRRWMRIGGIIFQPSEFAKYALVIYLSVFLSKKEAVLDDFVQGLLPAILIIAAIIVPVLLEPNLGTAFLIMLIATTLLIVGGANLKHMFILSLSAFSMITLFVRNISYQKARLLMFLDQVRGIEKPVWQVKQSLISLGSGGLVGVGLGNSKQKLHFLPQPFTDFIYSILGEELGLFGALFVAVLFLIFFLRTIRIAVKAPDRGGMFLAIGVGISIMIYFLFNAGVASNLMPITGIPMPFFSYGGSSLVMNMFAVGILLNISSQQKEAGVATRRGIARR